LHEFKKNIDKLKFMGGNNNKITRILGTPDYIAPEILKG
jgi:hypothetical protein